MPIVIRAKIGTGPSGYVRIKSKRRRPVLHEYFLGKASDARGMLDVPYQKWDGFIADRIDGDIYFLERM